MSDSVIIQIINACATIATAIVAAYGAYFGQKAMTAAKRAEDQAVLNGKNTDETKVAVALIEKNTNSMKDALVKVTGEREYQRGQVDAVAAGAIATASEEATYQRGLKAGSVVPKP